MAENRVPREIDNRVKAERPKQWMPPELLPEPDKQPGYKYHWVRVSLNGQADPRNLSSKLREHWEPVALEEQPHFKLLVDPSSRFADNIEIGGLLLCKAPQDLVDQRNSYYVKQSDSQIEAVDNNLMRQSDARMPLFKERKSTTSFGKGNN